MVDAPACGQFFTWFNKQEATSRVYWKLDRALINHPFMQHGWDYAINFKPPVASDHSLYWVQFQGHRAQKGGIFRFLNAWKDLPSFYHIVTEAWSLDIKGCLMFQIAQKLKVIKANLKQLHRSSFLGISVKVVAAYDALLRSKECLQLDLFAPHLI